MFTVCVLWVNSPQNPCLFSSLWHRVIEEGFIQKPRQKVVVSVWGDKIICRTGNLTVMCGIVYTAVVLFPLLLLEGGGGGMFCVDLYFKLNTHTHTGLIILLINYLLECCKTFDGKPINLS